MFCEFSLHTNEMWNFCNSCVAFSFGGFSATLLPMNIKRTVLPNGLRIITVPMKDAPTVTVLAMVEVGSKYENKQTSGLSHFLEHMCFKGTEKRPAAKDISRELDTLGAQYNAFTSEEFTGYWAKAAKNHVEKLVDVVSDIYLNSTFPAAEIEKEKGVIVEEINMYRDMPQRHVQELFMKALYGDQPAGWSIAGTKETVRSFTRENFLAYHAEHYVAKATTIIVAGGFNQAKVIGLLKKALAGVNKTKKSTKLAVVEEQKAPAIIVEHRPTDQSHIVLGVRGYPVGHKNQVAAEVLTSILGGGMSSRLFQRLREEMGIGYYVRASYDALTDHGILSVSLGCDTKRVGEGIEAILAEFKKLKTELVGKEELVKIKQYIAGGLLLELESSDHIAEFFGHQEILRQGLKKPAELIAKINKITAADIQRVANELFLDSKLNLAGVGPLPEDAVLKSYTHL